MSETLERSWWMMYRFFPKTSYTEICALVKINAFFATIYPYTGSVARLASCHVHVENISVDAEW